MVRVGHIARLGRFDVNATFGEDNAPVGRGFVPSLGRLGRLGKGLGLLQMGATGPRVEVLQQYLVDEGATLAVDGIFGADTQVALIAYQKKVGLPATGTADEATLDALISGTLTTPVQDALPTPLNVNAPWPWPKKYNVPILVGGIGIVALGVGFFFYSRER